ncbi:MAG: response regulator transcription factor [Verrucomicrobiota bacterium]
MSAKILIVEDDTTLLRVVADNFDDHHYQVTTTGDGQDAIDLALAQKFDLIVLDVMLPRVNGYEICRFLRAEKIDTPIIFLTAKSEESDQLLGLGLGADDYLAKPFSIKVLLARAEAILRRSQASSAEATTDYHFGRFLLDTAAHRLMNRDDELSVSLSPKEYRLLHYLLDHRGIALSRDQIMNEVWGYDSRVTPRTIDRFVTSLRKKIETSPSEHIETIREFGYRFRATT